MSARAALGLPALGIVCPLGRGKDEVARALFAGARHGLAPRSGLVAGRTVHVGAVAGALPELPAALAPGYRSRNNRLMAAALAEIAEDIAAAKRRYGAGRIAVVLGTSTSGIADAEDAFAGRAATGAWPPGYDWRTLEMGNLAEFAASHCGLGGPTMVVSTACTSSAKAMAAAARFVRAGLCDAAVVGGADTLARLTTSGFSALESVSQGRCNPMSANRDGVNIGEGAVAFLMTADASAVHLLGAGESSDAHHISAPDPSGAGALVAMRAALEQAATAPDAVAYVNLHGTATALNDAMEAKSVAALLGTDVPCSSTKGMTGHLLGAAGALEAAFLWLSLEPRYAAGRLPPHLWDGVRDPEIAPIRLVAPGESAPFRERAVMLSNSFAFGGNNCSLVLGRRTFG